MKRLFAALIGLFLVAPALADSTINNLGAGSAVSATDIFPAYQGANPATGPTAAQIKTFVNTSAVDARTTTSEAIANSDQGKLVTFSNGSAVACTIAQAGAGGNFAAGWAVSLRNLGAGTVTCTATTSKIDTSGAGGSFTLTTGQGLDLYSDGTDYFTQPGKGSTSPGGSSGQLQTNNGAGGFGAVAAPSGAVVGTSDSQTLTNKSIAASEVNSGTLAAAQMPALTGDCATSAGAVATSCNTIHAGYQASKWYFFGGQYSTATGGTAATNTIACKWLWVAQPITISQLGGHVTTVASGNVQYALYKTGTNGLPAALIDKTANVSVATTQGVKSGALGANQSVGPGTANGANFWFCYNSDNATVVFTTTGSSDTIAYGYSIGDSTADNLWNAISTATTALGLQCTGAACNGGSSTFNTWPASLAGTTWTRQRPGASGDNIPLMQFLVNSVP